MKAGNDVNQVGMNFEEIKKKEHNENKGWINENREKKNFGTMKSTCLGSLKALPTNWCADRKIYRRILNWERNWRTDHDRSYFSFSISDRNVHSQKKLVETTLH